MSISTANEIDQLLSLVLGEAWLLDALGSKSDGELQRIATLAESNTECAISQIAELGRALNCCDKEVDHGRIAWIITHLAYYAEVASTMASEAEAMRDPAVRRVLGAPPLL